MSWTAQISIFLVCWITVKQADAALTVTECWWKLQWWIISTALLDCLLWKGSHRNSGYPSTFKHLMCWADHDLDYLGLSQGVGLRKVVKHSFWQFSLRRPTQKRFISFLISISQPSGVDWKECNTIMTVMSYGIMHNWVDVAKAQSQEVLLVDRYGSTWASDLCGCWSTIL